VKAVHGSCFAPSSPWQCGFPCKVKRETPPPLFAVLKPEETQPVKCTRMEPMGNYAYHIDFSDGHNTGIYSFEFLRRIGESTVTEQSRG
jgi:hypothetical protein